MPSERASRIVNPTPLSTPSENQRAVQTADDVGLTLGELARKRIAALGVQEPPARSIDDIPDWVRAGG